MPTKKVPDEPLVEYKIITIELNPAENGIQITMTTDGRNKKRYVADNKKGALRTIKRRLKL